MYKLLNIMTNILAILSLGAILIIVIAIIFPGLLPIAFMRDVVGVAFLLFIAALIFNYFRNLLKK